MPIQFKFKEAVADDRRREVVDALEKAGFAARPLFPGQKRPALSSIYTVSGADAADLDSLHAALGDFHGDLDYTEAAPKREIK